MLGSVSILALVAGSVAVVSSHVAAISLHIGGAVVAQQSVILRVEAADDGEVAETLHAAGVGELVALGAGGEGVGLDICR